MCNNSLVYGSVEGNREHMHGFAVLSSLCLARSESTCLGIDAALPVLTLVNVLPAHTPGPRNDFRISACV